MEMLAGPLWLGQWEASNESLDLSSLGVIINYLYMMQERIPIITQFFNMILTFFFFFKPFRNNFLL